jgi:5,10-methenyltetrahydrofolate synthetase
MNRELKKQYSHHDHHDLLRLREKELMRSTMRTLLKKQQLLHATTHQQGGALLSHCEKERIASKRSSKFDEIVKIKVPDWNNASAILLYAPLPGEPDPLILLHSIFHVSKRNEQSWLETLQKKKLLFPRIYHDKLHLYQWNRGANWVQGSYGIQEPDPKTWKEAALEEVDVGLIPGLAFDHTGGRLGRGGGFYDRLLGDSRWRGLKTGIAWPWQLVLEVPKEPHDICMDYVVAIVESPCT